MCILGNKVLILKRVMQLFILQQLKVLVYHIAGNFAGSNFCEDAINYFFRISPNYN